MADHDFIAGCHERVRAIYRYWDGKRNGRLMPSRAYLDPVDIPKLLPDICLVDVVPDARRYVYRLIGTNECAMRGRDPTGLPVGDGYFGTSKDSVFLNYDGVARSRAPLQSGQVRSTITRSSHSSIREFASPRCR